MKFLLYGLNYAPELTGAGKYSGELAEYLSQNHEVKVVTSFPYYPSWEKRKGDGGLRYRFEFLKGVGVVRCPLWVSRRMSTLRRLIHLSSFVISSAPVLFWCLIRHRPDWMMVVLPTFICLPLGIILGKVTGVSIWVHVQDFEIDAMFGLDASRRRQLNWRKKWIFAIESFWLRRADRCSTISAEMLNKLESKCHGKPPVELLPNWVDVDFFRPLESDDQIREEYGYGPDDFIVLYAGNIGLKQGLDQLPALVESTQDLERVRFLIVGDGVYLKRLKASLDFAIEEGKVRFMPLQPIDHLVRVMGMADIHLVLQKRDISDLVLPSKLTTILSMGGHALITAPEESHLGRLVSSNPGIATLLPPEEPQALEEGLRKLADASTPLHKPNLIARQYAERALSREGILRDFEILLSRDLVSR